MLLKRMFLIVSVVLPVIAKAYSMQSIEIVNNSAQAIHIASNTANPSLYIDHVVPAFTKSLVIVQVTKLKNLQDLLFDAILKDSAEDIRSAIFSGASVNLEREGKTPLLWAVLLHRPNAARCLLEYGAF